MSKTTSRSDYELIGVFNAVSSELTTEVCAFWERNGVISDPAERTSRARQLVCIARNANGEIAGVGTAYRQSMVRDGVRAEVFAYRTFIQPADRQPLLFVSLFFGSCLMLEKAAVNGVPDQVIFITENPKFLRPKFMQRIFAGNKCEQIGLDPRGLPIWKYHLHRDGPHRQAKVSIAN